MTWNILGPPACCSLYLPRWVSSCSNKRAPVTLIKMKPNNSRVHGGMCKKKRKEKKKWYMWKVKHGTLRRENGGIMPQMLFIIGKNIAPSYRFVSSVSPPGTTFTVNSRGSALWAAVQERPRLAQTSWQGGDYLSFGCGSQNIMQRLEIDLAERNTAQLLGVAKTGTSWSVGFCHAGCWDGGNKRSWVDSSFHDVFLSEALFL